LQRESVSVSVAHRLHRRELRSAALNRGFFVHHADMLVRIVKVPPAGILEGLDLRPYKLRRSEIRELARPVADVLVAWEYAELFPDRRRPGNPRIPPKKHHDRTRK
jgi:hypothetical protein